MEIAKQEYELLADARRVSYEGAFRRFEHYLLLVSITGVAIGTVFQVDDIDRDVRVTLTWILAANAVILGVATFGRLVELHLNGVVYTRGLNRLRWWFLDQEPHLRDVFVLSDSDRTPSFGGSALFLSKASFVAAMNSVIGSGGLSLLPVAKDASGGATVYWVAICFVGSYAMHLIYLTSRASARKSDYERHVPELDDHPS